MLLVLVVALPDQSGSGRIFEVLSCGPKDFRTITGGCQKPAVTHPTKKSSDDVRLVVVIDAETLLPRASADGAASTLKLEESVILAGLKAVREPDTGVMRRR